MAYKIQNSSGEMLNVDDVHAPIIDKHLESGNYKAIDDFYDPEHEPSNKVQIFTGDQKYNVKSLAPRIGERKNSDGTVSTHKMAYSSGDGKYKAYPTLFQNDKQEWQELSDKDNWAALKEAEKRNEVFTFNNEKNAAAFANGDWKDKYKSYDIRSKEYADIYNSGNLTNYDDKTNTYIATPFKPFEVTAKGSFRSI